jgi:hypothetical protein
VGVILDSTSFYAEQGGQVSNQFWGHIWVGRLGIDFSPLPVYGHDQKGSLGAPDKLHVDFSRGSTCWKYPYEDKISLSTLYRLPEQRVLVFWAES